MFRYACQTEICTLGKISVIVRVDRVGDGVTAGGQKHAWFLLPWAVLSAELSWQPASQVSAWHTVNWI